MKNVQNCVKFTTKCYKTVLMPWRSGVASENYSDYQNYQEPLWLSKFIGGNLQFKKNLDEYHYIKINYLAVKVHEVSYIGILTAPTGSGASGITSTSMDNHPTYIVWDLEEDMSFNTEDNNQVTPQQVAQYQYTKSLRPSSKKPVTFLYHVPLPWRQYFDTFYFKAESTTKNLIDVMERVSGVKNLRAPKHLLITHPNYWIKALPDEASTGHVKIYTQVGMTFYMGVTFRGRTTMGLAGATYADEVTQELETNIEDMNIKEEDLKLSSQ